jgi:F-type H+-transporting ATPase subunit epsilon
MATQLSLSILTPSGATDIGGVEGESSVFTSGVEIPGILGEVGILPDHIPLVTAIVPGVVRFKVGEESKRVAVGAGFVEVTAEGVVSILADRVALPADIDADATRKDLEAAKAALAALKDSIESPEYVLAARKQAWCEAQLRAVGKL